MTDKQLQELIARCNADANNLRKQTIRDAFESRGINITEESKNDTWWVAENNGYRYVIKLVNAWASLKTRYHVDQYAIEENGERTFIKKICTRANMGKVVELIKTTK